MGSFGIEKTHSLLDIPEELILHIFSYLTNHVVHFHVRNVCRMLKILAEHHLYLRVLKTLWYWSGVSPPASISQS